MIYKIQFFIIKCNEHSVECKTTTSFTQTRMNEKINTHDFKNIHRCARLISVIKRYRNGQSITISLCVMNIIEK